MSRTNNPDLHRFLERLTSRSVLTTEEQQAILGFQANSEQISANRDFVRLGETVDHATLILSGVVGRFDQVSNGARQITAMHVVGDMANLHSVVQPKATSALQALSPATVLHVPHSCIRRATARFPALAEALWRDCMVDNSVLSQWVLNTGRRNAKARIAHLLCEIATRMATPISNNACVFGFRVTQAQVADATGMTSVHVNRVLKELRVTGIAHICTQEVHVFDWKQLVKAGDFDAGYLQNEKTEEDRLRITPLICCN